jgi:hypothetical protein
LSKRFDSKNDKLKFVGHKSGIRLEVKGTMLQHYSSKRLGRRLALCLLVITIMLPVRSLNLVSRADSPNHSALGSGQITGARAKSGFVSYEAGGVAGCRLTRPEEAEAIERRDTTQELQVISSPQIQSDSGLQIILRATPALEANPAAKAAFLRAANAWASRVQTPTLVVIDVDFAPTWFGETFPDGAIGITNPQMLFGFLQYYSMLSQLQCTAADEHELSLYQNLPQPPLMVPTDLGETAHTLAPAAVYRTLGMINSDPDYDAPAYGPKPAIGFNSNVSFDFDPSDGVDAGKYDFEGMVMHEIGHVLGFVSAVGQCEIDPDCDLALTVWDLFRLRPGATMGSLPTADRILSTGGAQVFFEGNAELQLSTGVPLDGGQDGLQPSHWRDDSALGQRIGLMDPSVMPGVRATLTFNDLAALDLFGYTLKPFGNNKPTVSLLTADLSGDVLTLTGAGADVDGDVAQAQTTLLNQKGQVLAQTAPFSTDYGIVSTFKINMRFTGMGGQPEATQMSLVFIDSRGNKSVPAVVDFSGGDPGSPKLSTATYDGRNLVLKGKKFTADMQVEVNGMIVAPPANANLLSAKKLSVTATRAALNLRDGSNRVRVISGGLRSSLLVANL